MKISDLLKYNPNAELQVVVNNSPVKYDISFGSNEGVTIENCDIVNLEVNSFNEYMKILWPNSYQSKE